jgi:hypothetical protein
LFTSQETNINGQVISTSTFRDINGLDGPTLLFRFSFNDLLLSAADIPDLLQPGEVYLEPQFSTQTSFNLSATGTDGPFFWFDDNTEYFQNEVTFTAPLDQTSVLGYNYISPSGCVVSSTLQLLDVPLCPEFPSPDFVNVVVNDPLTITYYPPASFASYESVLWQVNGVSMQSSGSEPITLPFENDVPVVIFLSLSQNGVWVPVIVQSIQGLTSNCDTPEVHLTVGVSQAPMIQCIYYDGVQAYQSYGGCMNTVVQPNEAEFIIESVEPFELNENGEPTVKVTFSAKMMLFDLSIPGGQPQWFEVQHGVIAFAYE